MSMKIGNTISKLVNQATFIKDIQNDVNFIQVKSF